VGAHGEGDTEEAALEDLREALTGLERRQIAAVD
jgi:hypothetical protein